MEVFFNCKLNKKYLKNYLTTLKNYDIITLTNKTKGDINYESNGVDKRKS